MRKFFANAARGLAAVRYRMTSAALMMALLLFPGTCKKKNPPVPPPQAQPPTVTQPQQPPPTTEQAPPQQTEEKKTEEQPVQTKPATKPKPHAVKKKPQPEMKKPAPPASATTTKPGTQQPPPTEPGQLTASLSGTEAARRRQETAQLLTLTDNELKSIKRSLSTEEQNIVLQIRGYMQQSQSADKDGDLDRARILATKAKVLADDLIKR